MSVARYAPVLWRGPVLHPGADRDSSFLRPSDGEAAWAGDRPAPGVRGAGACSAVPWTWRGGEPPPPGPCSGRGRSSARSPGVRSRGRSRSSGRRVRRRPDRRRGRRRGSEGIALQSPGSVTAGGLYGDLVLAIIRRKSKAPVRLPPSLGTPCHGPATAVREDRGSTPHRRDRPDCQRSRPASACWSTSLTRRSRASTSSVSRSSCFTVSSWRR